MMDWVTHAIRLVVLKALKSTQCHPERVRFSSMTANPSRKMQVCLKGVFRSYYYWQHI
jgi:hypothetical protein